MTQRTHLPVGTKVTCIKKSHYAFRYSGTVVAPYISDAQDNGADDTRIIVRYAAPEIDCDIVMMAYEVLADGATTIDTRDAVVVNV